MDCLFEIIFQALGEAFLGAVFQFLVEGIARMVAVIFGILTGAADDPRRPADDLRIARAILYQLMGLAAGAVSLLFFHKHMIATPVVRILNLIVTPFLMATMMVQWGKLLARYNRKPTPLNHFVCAYGFALCYLLVRYFFAK